MSQDLVLVVSLSGWIIHVNQGLPFQDSFRTLYLFGSTSAGLEYTIENYGTMFCEDKPTHEAYIRETIATATRQNRLNCINPQNP